MNMTYAQMTLLIKGLALLAYFMANIILILLQLFVAPQEQKPKFWGTKKQKLRFGLTLFFGVFMAIGGFLPFVRMELANVEEKRHE